MLCIATFYLQEAILKILHTSDWHLGKKLKNVSRLQEQKQVLNELIEYVETSDIDVVIIAGDVYDVFSPSASAEELFYSVLKELSNKTRAVIVISGNHDDNSRVTAGASVCYDYGVLFATKEFLRPLKLKRVEVVRANERFFEIKDNNGETVFFNVLPYPNEQILLKTLDDDALYTDKIASLIKQGSSYNVNNRAEILVSHLFMAGGVSDGGEKPIELGGARLVDINAIPSNVIYTALGHLHKYQVINKQKNVVYSGSILQYDYGEKQEKYFTVLTVENGALKDIERVEFKNGKKLKVVDCYDFYKLYEILDTFCNCYVKLRLYLSQPLHNSELTKLLEKYPFITDVEFLNDAYEGEENAVDRRTLNDKELFIEYYKKLFNVEPKRDMVELYLKMLEDGVEL